MNGRKLANQELRIELSMENTMRFHTTNLTFGNYPAEYTRNSDSAIALVDLRTRNNPRYRSSGNPSEMLRKNIVHDCDP